MNTYVCTITYCKNFYSFVICIPVVFDTTPYWLCNPYINILPRKLVSVFFTLLTRRLSKGQREPSIEVSISGKSMGGSLCPLVRRLVKYIKYPISQQQCGVSQELSQINLRMGCNFLIP